MLVWFTSDPHFSCPNTLKREHRPFDETSAYDEHVISVWNSQVRRKDVIYVIGDFASCGEHWKEGLSKVAKINSRVVLVLGNNEQKIVRTYFGNNFVSFKRYCLKIGFTDTLYSTYVRVGKHSVYLTHEPRNHNINHITLFGHVHKGVGQFKPYGFNVFLDLNYFRLYSGDDILDLVETRNRYWRYSPNIWDNEKPNENVFK